jgi:hypothetical protein
MTQHLPSSPLACAEYKTSLLDAIVFEDSLYYINDDVADYATAHDICKATGGNLASVHSAMENALLRDLTLRFMNNMPTLYGGWLADVGPATCPMKCTLSATSSLSTVALY